MQQQNRFDPLSAATSAVPALAHDHPRLRFDDLGDASPSRVTGLLDSSQPNSTFRFAFRSGYASLDLAESDTWIYVGTTFGGYFDDVLSHRQFGMLFARLLTKATTQAVMTTSATLPGGAHTTDAHVTDAHGTAAQAISARHD